MSVHEYARRQPLAAKKPADMTAGNLVQQLVSLALDKPNAHEALCDLAGVLYDASSSAFDRAERYARLKHTDELVRDLRATTLELRDHAGYVLRVAGTIAAA